MSVSQSLLNEIKSAEKIMRQREYNARYKSKKLGVPGIAGAYGDDRYDYQYMELKKADATEEQAMKYLEIIQKDLKDGVGLGVVKDPDWYKDLKAWEKDYNKDVSMYVRQSQEIKNISNKLKIGREALERFTETSAKKHYSKYNKTSNMRRAIMQDNQKSVYQSLSNYKKNYVKALDSRIKTLSTADNADVIADLENYRNRIEKMSVNEFATYDAAGALRPIDEWYIEMTAESLRKKMSEDFSVIKQLQQEQKKTGKVNLKLSKKQHRLPKSVKRWARM